MKSLPVQMGHVVLWLLVAVLMLAVLLPTFRGCAGWIQATARARRGNHLLMYIVGVLFAGASVALFDVIDLSQVLDGEIVSRDIFLIPIFIVCGSLTIWVSAQTWWLEQSLGSEIERLEGQISTNDTGHSKRLKLEQGQLRKVQSERDDLAALVKAHVAVLQERKRRLARLLTSRRSDDTKHQICASDFMTAMDPPTQRHDLLRAIHGVMLHRLKAKGQSISLNAKLRLALFEDLDGYMSVVESFDGIQFNVINAPMKKYREFFKIDPSNNSTLAVGLLSSETTVIVEDTHDADASRGLFQFFSEQHKETILSIAGFRIDDGTEHAGRRMTFVLDSNVRGFFTSLDKPLMDLFRDTMKTRIQYECQLERVSDGLCCRNGCCKNE